MSRRRDSTALIVFAKAPIAGQVKTRLIPALGAHGAASLYRQMLHHTLVTACQAGFGGVELCCTPDCGHDLFRQLAAEFPVKLSRQQGTDLGRRMGYAMSDALQRYRQVILIGSDCPQLRVADLLAAEAHLSPSYPLVLGPATDGGYVLIGAQALVPGLFSDVPWGSSEVLEISRRRIRESGIKWRELRAFQDIDRPADLAVLGAGFVLKYDTDGEMTGG